MKKPEEELIINITAVIVVIVLLILLYNVFFSGKTSKKALLTIDKVAALSIPSKILPYMRELSVKYNIDFAELTAVYSLHNDFFPNKSVAQTKEEIEQTFMMNYEKIKSSYKLKDIDSYERMFGSLFSEIKYFPVMLENEFVTEPSYMFGDTFGSNRNYEGDKTHEGCDIMDRDNVRGRIPVASMTDGVIEDIGWSNTGGFSIGIRTQKGNYYYYAHFERYAESFIEGSKITAGQLLGYMGDTGYGKKEGTAGNFPVHLHVGIKIKTDLSKEAFWINPYPFLRLYEANKIVYMPR